MLAQLAREHHLRLLIEIYTGIGFISTLLYKNYGYNQILVPHKLFAMINLL